MTGRTIQLKHTPRSTPLVHKELIDSHCHLEMIVHSETELNALLQDAQLQGVQRVITIGTDLQSSEKSRHIASTHSGVFASIGVHPHGAAKVTPSDYERLAILAQDVNVVGYGEIGLDYAKMYAPKEIQQQVFREQLSLAKELGLPVIIHDRDAHEDIMHLLKQQAPYPAGGVMHCFSGDTHLAEQVLDLGFFISIPGIVTFPNAHALQQVVIDLPLEKMILETDAPFLAPVPYRGKTNTPCLLIHTAEKIAQLKNSTLHEVAQQTTKNTEILFHLPPSCEKYDCR